MRHYYLSLGLPDLEGDVLHHRLAILTVVVAISSKENKKNELQTAKERLYSYMYLKGYINLVAEALFRKKFKNHSLKKNSSITFIIKQKRETN